MAFSDAARDVIKNELDNRAARSSNSKNQVTYAVDVGLMNPARDGKIAAASFKFSKPVSQDLLEKKSSTMLNYLSKNLDLQGDIGVIDAMLQSIVGNRKVSRKRSTGTVSVQFGDPTDITGSGAAVTGANGRFVSMANLKAILELVAKEYLIKDMKRAGAPLKYRTGRFANSLRIKDVVQPGEKQGDTTRPPQLGITYSYQTRPYSVFDPRVSTYRRLSLRPFAGARNPQKLIGDAIAKAARDLIHSRYRITVNQGT